MRRAIIVILLFMMTVCMIVACKSEPTKYIGNTNTKVFHKESCSHLPSEVNRIVFDTRDAAISAGYSACGVCKP